MPLNTLSELTGDFVVYRNLEPFDPRVPGLQAAWRDMGLDRPRLVRKREPGYVRAAAWMLRRFHALHAPGRPPAELLFIGDTVGGDGAAFRRLAEHTGWQGAAFIGDERMQELAAAAWQGDLYAANRWGHLAHWLADLQSRRLALDARTIAIVDIDKTALGARGRNHQPIDATRLAGLQETVLKALGADLNLDAFTAIYHDLNRPAYHDLTEDNQDYLAYVCIMLGAGVLSLDELHRARLAGQSLSFDAFIGLVQDLAGVISPRLQALHQAVYAAYQAGDPTPFKAFRRNEYRAAAARMGNLPDDADPALRRTEEICLTREVWDACRWLQQRGVLIGSLSDKPDEACAPDPALAAHGYRPIHDTPTHLLGEPLAI